MQVKHSHVICHDSDAPCAFNNFINLVEHQYNTSAVSSANE